MTEAEANNFISTMRGYNPRIVDMEEAITCCMQNVRRHTDADLNLKWFGFVAGGTFYCDFNHFRWFEDSRPGEVIGSLEAEFGKELTDNLEY